MAEFFSIVVIWVSAHDFLRGHTRVMSAQCNRLDQHNAKLQGGKGILETGTLLALAVA
jgi:hypothetical protein